MCISFFTRQHSKSTNQNGCIKLQFSDDDGDGDGDGMVLAMEMVMVMVMMMMIQGLVSYIS